jgi:integrase/recombinase XerD
MSLGKQAKTLTKGQGEAVLGFLAKTRYPIRNRTIFLLSLKAGLRAKEIALLTWEMITDADGQVGQAIHLQDKASKGRSGRIIPLNGELRSVLQALKDHLGSKTGKYVVSSERSAKVSPQTIVNMFSRWYEVLGFNGCSSHSGRRTFITNTARKISTVGGSIRDVQELAGHTNLRTTQRYIDVDANAQKKVVLLI